MEIHQIRTIPPIEIRTAYNQTYCINSLMLKMIVVMSHYYLTTLFNYFIVVGSFFIYYSLAGVGVSGM